MSTVHNHSVQLDETRDHTDASAATAGTSTRRINVNFAPSAYAALERLAQRCGKTLSEVLRDAIQLERWLPAAEDEGWHLLLERDGCVRELARIRWARGNWHRTALPDRHLRLATGLAGKVTVVRGKHRLSRR